MGFSVLMVFFSFQQQPSFCVFLMESVCLYNMYSRPITIIIVCTCTLLGASYYLCPRVDETIIEESPCPAECYGDSQCSGDDSELNNTLCCPTSNCGRQCMRGVSIPYHPQPPVCPELDSDIVGACTEFCSSDSDCSETNQICCSNGCGHGCVTVSPTCRRILESRNGTFLIGEYRPQCDDDGMFTQIQCHGSTGNCWCVRPETGEPVSTSISRQPECNSKWKNKREKWKREKEYFSVHA